MPNDLAFARMAASKRFQLRDAVLLCAMLCLCSTTLATAVTIGAAKDNTIFQQNSNNSAGGWSGITSGTNTMGFARRGLLAFDIAGILPAGSTITSSQLTMYLGDINNINPQTVELHKLTKDWGEGTANSSPTMSGTGMGAAASPGDATWSHAMLGSVSWSSLGATGDFIEAASGSTVISGPIDTSVTWSSTAGMVSDVQNWLDAPATNFGWALINMVEASARSQKTFYSHEATQNSSGVPNSLDPAWRPMLTITFESSSAPSGDYNGNGVVDAADYIAWRKTLGSAVSPLGSGADGNKSGTIDDGDLTYWRARFGTVPNGTETTATVPEPAIECLLFVIGPLVFVWKRR